MLFRIGVWIYAATILVGCQTVDRSGRSHFDVETEHVFLDEIKLGVPQFASTGENMLSIRAYDQETSKVNVVRPNKDFTILSNSVYDEAKVEESENLVVLGHRVKNGETVTIVKIPGTWHGMEVSSDGVIQKSIYNGNIVMIWSLKYEPPNVRLFPAIFENIAVEVTGPSYDVAYNGTDGASMKFQYREYADDSVISPSLTQDFSYPIESSVVKFRSIEIEIVDVNPDGIQYVVKHGLD